MRSLILSSSCQQDGLSNEVHKTMKCKICSSVLDYEGHYPTTPKTDPTWCRVYHCAICDIGVMVPDSMLSPDEESGPSMMYLEGF